jgi:iron complex outermembrane receptor protein
MKMILENGRDTRGVASQRFRTQLLLTSALFSAEPALAQAVTEAASSADASVLASTPKVVDQIEQIVITAQRRPELAMDVPISVDTISGTDLDRFGGQSPTDLQFLSPSLQVTHDNFDNFAIRGVGTTTTGYAVDQAVSVVVDDVVIALPTDLGIGTLSDIQQVEILRGPQGTLYGKNSTAGVVNVRTVAPSLDGAFGDVSVDYGERNEVRAVGSVNLPLSSTAALRVSNTYQQQDGFIHNVLGNYYEGGASDEVVRAKFLWRPSDRFELYAIGDYARHTGSDAQFSYTLLNAGTEDVSSSTGLGINPGLGNYHSAGTVPTRATGRHGGASLHLTYHADPFDITSISAYRSLSNYQNADVDATPAPLLEGGVSTDAYQMTQELRIASTQSTSLQYQAGLFYYYRSGSELWFDHGTFGIPGYLPPGVFYSYAGGLEHDPTTYRSVAGYADATYAITSRLKLTGGFRYTADRVTQGYYVDPINPNWIALGGPAISYQNRLYGTYQRSDPSGRAVLHYEVTPSLTTYVSYSRGYKGPAIESGNGGQTRIDPETVNSYEIGLKGSAFANRLTFDFAAFNADYDHFQAQAYDPTTLQVQLTNAGGLRTRGIEVGLRAQPVKRLSLSVGAAYTDAIYTDYIASCYSGQVVGCNMTTRTTQAAGTPLPNSAKWSLTSSVLYVQPLADGKTLDASTGVYYKSKSYAVGYDPNTVIDGFSVVSLNAGFSAPNGAWRIGMFARNLFDQPVISSIFNFAGGRIAAYSPDSRRTVGVSFRMSTCVFDGGANCRGSAQP